MAARFWVGGAGAVWDSTAGTKWATVSNGAGGAAAPTSSDDVTFDNHSNGAGVAVTSTATCRSLTITSGFTQTIGMQNTYLAFDTISVAVSVVLPATLNMSLLQELAFNFSGSGAMTLTTNGLTLGGVKTTGTGTVTLQDNLITRNALTITTGGFNDGGHDVSADSFSSSGTGTRTVTGGSSSTWSFTTNNSVAWDTTTTTGMTFTAPGTVKLVNVGDINPGGLTFLTLWFASGAGTINGSLTINTEFKDSVNTFHHVIVKAGATLSFGSSAVITLGGSAGGDVYWWTSDSSGSFFTVSKASGTLTFDYLELQDSHATGGATWDPGIHSLDDGGNSGWTFAASPQTLTPAKITFSQSFKTPVITTTVGLHPSLFTNTPIFYAAVVAKTDQALTANLFTNTQIFYSPVSGGGNYILLPSLFSNGQTFYAEIVLSAGTLLPSLFTNAQSFKVPVITLFLKPSLMASGTSFFTHSLSIINSLLPALFTNSQSFKNPQIGIHLPFIQPPPPTVVYFTQPKNVFYSPTVRHTAPAGDGNRPMRIINGRATFFRT